MNAKAREDQNVQLRLKKLLLVISVLILGQIQKVSLPAAPGTITQGINKLKILYEFLIKNHIITRIFSFSFLSFSSKTGQKYHQPIRSSAISNNF